MPCYEAPIEHEEREREFFVAALCFLTKKVDMKDLTFPGLREWKERHDIIDATGKRPEASSYDKPEYMRVFMKKFPKKQKPWERVL
jgi:hypothetical protein